MMNKNVVGHTFLAKLGKTRLRPGGIKATNWLLRQSNLQYKNILEVACNQGTTALEIAKKYECNILAIDKDHVALKKAKAKLAKTSLQTKLEFRYGNAFRLEFPEHSFDVILNEAMLTMLDDQAKSRALCEYQKVLKHDGLLLTHDICFLTEDKNLQAQICNEMTAAINIQVAPKSIKDWVHLFEDAGFKNLKLKTGKISLLNPIGMIRDEGFFNTLKIIKRALRKENKPQFKQMFKLFKKYKKHLGFVAIASRTS